MWYPTASKDYNSAKVTAVKALAAMTKAMKEMGVEHAEFHDHYADARKFFDFLKKGDDGKALRLGFVRSTASDPYLSDGNLPKVMALGRLEIGEALKTLAQEEQRLDELQKETARLVDILVNDYGREEGDGKSG